MIATTRLRKKIARRMKKDHPRGCYGEYIQISRNKGVKLYHERFNSPNDPQVHIILKRAIKEGAVTRIARERFSCIPKCYKVDLFKIDNQWAIGIVLQHLGNIKCIELDEDLRIIKKECITNILFNKLDKLGIVHSDLHENNIMYFKGKYWVIDFDPDRVTIKPDNNGKY